MQLCILFTFLGVLGRSHRSDTRVGEPENGNGGAQPVSDADHPLALLNCSMPSLPVLLPSPREDNFVSPISHYAVSYSRHHVNDNKVSKHL